jgi:FMN phosphatase YigB (HAD superfamily)
VSGNGPTNMPRVGSMKKPSDLLADPADEGTAGRGSGEEIRAVVFDLFDTLVDLYMEKIPRIEHRGFAIPASARALHAALPRRCGTDFDTFASVLGEIDREYRISHYKKGIELPSVERFGRLCDRLGIADATLPGLLAEVHMSLLREQVAMPLHHLGVVTELGQRVRLGLCSNFSHTPTARSILEDYGLEVYLDAIVISEEVGIRKPRDEIFETVLQLLGTEPGETLHVGDDLGADVAGAASSGMRTAWVTRRVKDPVAALESHDGPLPDYQIEDLSELTAILDPPAPEAEDGREGQGGPG